MSGDDWTDRDANRRDWVSTPTWIFCGIAAVVWLVFSSTIFLDQDMCKAAAPNGRWYERICDCLTGLKPNEFGDLLAGVFAPLAFLGVVVAVMLQSRELTLQRHELRRTGNILRDEVETLRLQTKILQQQEEDRRKSGVLREVLALSNNLFDFVRNNFSNLNVLKFGKSQNAEFRDTSNVGWDDNLAAVVNYFALTINTVIDREPDGGDLTDVPIDEALARLEKINQLRQDIPSADQLRLNDLDFAAALQGLERLKELASRL